MYRQDVLRFQGRGVWMVNRTRVLVVEDDAIVAKNIRRRLHNMDYQVVAIVASGEEAVQAAVETRPDVVLMDIQLKGEMDGVAAAARIHARCDVPVVYLSAHADEPILNRAKITEPFGYILKPFQDRELRSNIEIALYKHEQERQLRESEERYRAVSELTSDFAFSFHVQPDGGLMVEWMTGAFTRITGLGVEEIGQYGLLDIVHPISRSAAEETLRAVLSGQPGEIEMCVIGKSGESRWLHVYGRPVRDSEQGADGAQGRIVRVIGAGRDITERVEAERELRRYREHLEELVGERTAELIQTNQRLQSEIAERRRAERALKQRAEELSALNVLSQHVSISLSLDQVVQAGLEETAECVASDLAMLYLRQGDRLLLQGVYPSDHEFWQVGPEMKRVGQCLCGLAVAHSKPYYSRDIHTDPLCTLEECKQAGMRSFAALPLCKGDDVLAVLGLASTTERDFGERASFLEALSGVVAIGLQNALSYQQVQDHAAELEHSQLQLIRAEKMAALGRLAASIAHEINNPLQAVQGYLEMAREKLDGGQNRERIERYLGIAEAEIERITNIVRRMHEFYRQERAGLQDVDLRAVLKSVLDLSRKQLQHSEITVEREWDPGLPAIQANADQLKQVFLNMVINSIDAMPDGGTLRIRAALDRVRGRGDQRSWSAVRVEFVDTGVGMPPEVRARLFEPFFTTKEGGTGLGLSISYGIIESHGGDITVTSQVGVGTTFTILLPVRQP
jgi:PAS domain S-box-containing protein